MAKSPGNSTLEDSLGQYQRSLRERASRSLHQLKCALREVDVTVEEEALDPPTSINVENEDSGVAWYELQHSHAVNQLKALLRQQASKDNEMSPPRRRKMSPPRPSECEDSSMPSLHNLVPIINDQSQYIHHLEAEVKFCKDELSGMKNRVQVVVLENERLQQELKSQRQEETLREQTLLDASGNIQDSWIKTGEDSRVDEAAKRPFSHGDAETGKTTSFGNAEKWKLELERLKLTYEAKSDLLESQLTLLRKDLVEYQKTCEDLRERLKHKESLLAASASSRVGGLCLKCAQHEAVLSQTHSNVHIQTIETLTKERDDLMSALVSVRSSLAEVQQRETSAYKQVKQAVQMTEEASFEKTKASALMQCEQLKSELERQSERLEKELAAQLEKRAFEKEMIKKEVAKEREDAESKCLGHPAVLQLSVLLLALQQMWMEKLLQCNADFQMVGVGEKKILILSQNIAQLEAQVETVTREKVSAVSQLEDAQSRLASQEADVSEVCGEMRFQLNKTKMEKDEAEKEHREYKAKSQRDLEIKDEAMVAKVVMEVDTVHLEVMVTAMVVVLVVVIEETMVMVDQDMETKVVDAVVDEEDMVAIMMDEENLVEEIEKLRLELSESRQHVEQEQQKAARARQECLQVTELLGESERQLHLTRLEKDSIQQSFSNEAKAQALQAQQREQELTQKIQQMEAQHDKTENEQYSLLTSQNAFLTKLKEECRTLARKLEKISQKSRSEIVRLSQEKRYMCDKLEKLQKRNDELEEQCVQHGRVHETMKERAYTVQVGRLRPSVLSCSHSSVCSGVQVD
ncbi:Serologically defined colon cancer antigen 8-like protein [Microtus ochrogaster]|uniref:Serologically defined colon cancer antigen 8-like protein n=1 Tax=Microtus ochrogaster TaxID=79684 RepID=A0A8J6GHF1_MICOH|nr:Serologically defined colon cancer antigen 8-like protein [Microtus ochrogaster]